MKYFIFFISGDLIYVGSTKHNVCACLLVHLVAIDLGFPFFMYLYIYISYLLAGRTFLGIVILNQILLNNLIGNWRIESVLGVS